MRSLTLLSALVTTLVVAAPALAQEEGDGSETPAPKPKAKPVAVATPAAGPTEHPVDAKSDHETVVGRLGVGYLGSVQTPLGTGGNLTAHIVGIRYWAQTGLAITGGLGFGSSSSSISTAGVTADGPAATTFGLKGGVALALASGKHFTFVLEPQAVFGYATQKITQPNTTIEHSGNRFMLGATVGGEIQFGFMGIPELALVGSVGAAFDTQSGKTVTTSPGGTVENAAAATSIATFTLANPWNIFAGNISAIYYL